MTASATIDIDTLNNLFDNQKKLDDIFSSVFDDDSFFVSSSAPIEKVSDSKDQKAAQDSSSNDSSSSNDWSNDDWSYKNDDVYFVQEKRSIIYLIFPVMLEIAALYYGIMYFI